MDLYQQNPEFQIAEKICKKLQDQGYQALFAGGCVRDFLLKRIPNDFDVATNATPDTIEEIFPKTISVGKSFGVIIVVENEHQIEVATFRKDGPYQDGRRPESIEFSAAEEDAQRRDFTINGLFFDPQAQKVVDYVDGEKDLQAKKIRAIGEPQKRFEEDHLRLLRAVRFAAQLDFEIEASTWKAIIECSKLIQTVSGERIQDELTKLLFSQGVEVGLKLTFESGLLAQLIQQPDLQWQSPADDFQSVPQTKEDLWFRFFTWLQKLTPSKRNLQNLEKLCDQWKFSRDLKQKTLKALQWTLTDRPFQKHSLGELLALSYKPEHWRGLHYYAEQCLTDDERPRFQKVISRRLDLGSEEPKPWLTAADLSQKFQGESLGQALRQSYWEQLEGQFESKTQLLKKWGL